MAENNVTDVDENVLEAGAEDTLIDRIEQVIMAVLENEVLVLGLGALGLGFYYFYNSFADSETFESKEPDEVTQKWLKQELKHGQKTNKTLVEQNKSNLITRGKIKYEYADRVPGETISPVINPENTRKEEYTAKEDIWLFKVIPKNESTVKYFVFDYLLDKDKVAKYYIIKDENIEIYDDEVKIKEGVNIDYNRGVFMDRTTEAKNKANQIIRMESQNELVKGHVNYAPKVNHLAPTHSMDLDKIKEQQTEDEEI